MPVERALSTSIVQIAPETTPGTPVAATKRLGSISLSLAQDADVAFQGPTGYLFDTTSNVNRESASGDVSGLPNYAELQYPFSSLMGAAVITTPADGVLTRDWTFNILHNRQGTIKTFTIEQGDVDAGTAERAAYCFFNSLGLTFSRDGGNEVSGSIMGQIINYGFTLTDPTTVNGLPQVPIQSDEVNVYLDLDKDDIGVTQWVDAFSVGFNIEGRWNVGYPLNRSKSSFDRHFATKPEPTMTFQVSNNAAGRDLIDYFRERTTMFVRIDALGPLIESVGAGPTDYHYMFQLDMAVQLAAAFSPGDINGMATLDWTGRIVYDASWNKALTCKLRNTSTAL